MVEFDHCLAAHSRDSVGGIIILFLLQSLASEASLLCRGKQVPRPRIRSSGDPKCPAGPLHVKYLSDLFFAAQCRQNLRLVK